MRNCFLIIEPDASERALLQNLFSDRYKLFFVRDANEAFDIISEISFSVVVFNMGRAGNESLSELNVLKTHLRNNPMIIAITTYNTLEIERTIATNGVFYHLLKPYNVKDLSDLIDAAFRGSDRKYSSLCISDHSSEAPAPKAVASLTRQSRVNEEQHDSDVT